MAEMSESTASTPETAQDAANSPSAASRLSPPRRWKRLVLKCAFSLIVALLALKIGDAVLGRVRNTAERHWLQLTPNAAARHRSTEFDYVFHTNSLGFRGPDVAFAKPPGVKRLVVLGDSFVAGVGVPDDAVFTSRLQQQLERSGQKTQVVNLGRTGSGTIVASQLYSKFGPKFSPDVVILVDFLENDLLDTWVERTPDERSNWRPPGRTRGIAYRAFPNIYLELAAIRQESRVRHEGEPAEEADLLRQVLAAAVEKGFDREVAQRRFESVPEDIRRTVQQGLFPLRELIYAAVQPDRFRQGLNPDDEFFEKAWPRNSDQLNALKAKVEADGAEFRIVLMPSCVQIERDALDFIGRLGFETDSRWLSGRCRIQRELLRWAERNRVPCLDLTPRFRQSKQRLYHIRDRHLNKAGHAATAAAIGEWLRRDL
jgi:hypothetical protein